MSLRHIYSGAQEALASAMMFDQSHLSDAYNNDEYQSVHTASNAAEGNNSVAGGTVNSTVAGTVTSGDDDPARLFGILEENMPRHEQAGGGGTSTTLSANELQQKREMAEHTWDLVRKWLWAHPRLEQRQAASYIRGTAEATALHLMCKLPYVPVDVIRAMVEAAPEIVSWTDSHGWLPLHHACANGADPNVMKVLIDAYPSGKLAQDNQKRTPLHFYATRNHDNPAFMMQNAILLTDTGAAELTDKNGMLPMHYACAYGTDTVVLQVLAQVYPDSLTTRENKGRTPMHLAMVNAHRDSTPHVVEFLLQHPEARDTTNTRDTDGYLPLHLLALALRGYRADDPAKRRNVSQSLALYLNAEPYPAADFLNALQALPNWLQDTAVVSPHVRNVLNEKIVRRLPTAILMLDGYMLVVIIVCFGLASYNHLDLRFGQPGATDTTQVPIAFLFLGASYFLLREVVQMASLVSLNSFSSYFTDPTNWLDMCVIFLVFYYTLLMVHGNWGVSNDAFRCGCAFTQGVLYVDVIVYLKSTYVDFAVFVNGVYYVVQRMIAFLIALGVILLAFAQMLFFIYKNTALCVDDPSWVPDPDVQVCSFAHCTFFYSFLKMYVMMLGEINHVQRYVVGPTSLTAEILYVAYGFLVVVVLSNVLIAIVTDSYEVIQNDRAAIVFWSNRLDFVAEMDAIVFGAQRRLYCFGNTGFQKHNMALGAPIYVKETADGMDLVTTERGSPSVKWMRGAWEQVMLLFKEEIYEDIDAFESFVYNLFRLLAILFIIPFWILLGVISVGILWPPQIREFLFVQKEAGISRAEVEHRKLEKLISIQNDMKILKQEIMREMENDRDEVMRMRADVETVQTEVLADLQQVKELLSSLLGE